MNRLNTHLIRKIVQSHSIFICIVASLGLWGIQALFHPGLFTAHDIWHNVARFYWYIQALLDGGGLPAWIAPLANGYGYPLFIFSYPLPWIIGAPLTMMGIPIEIAIKILYSSSFIFSGIFAYCFGVSMFKSRLSALTVAVLYMIAPYHFLTIFVSAAMGIAFGYMFLPLLFWGIWEVLHQKSFWGIPLISIGLFGIITSHLILAVMAAPFVTAWILWNILSLKYKSQAIKNLLVGILFGFGLAAFYLLPFGYYSNLIRASDDSAGFSKLYQTNFASLKQLIYSPWGFGPIISNAKDGEISLQVGLAQWASMGLVILGFFILLLNVIRSKYTQSQFFNNKLLFWRIKQTSLIVLLFLISIFAIWEASKPLWDLVSQYLPLDYPFRLLAISVLFGSLLAGSLISLSKNPLIRAVLTIFFISIALYTNRNHRQINLYTDIPIKDYVQSEKTTNTFDEYLPLVSNRSLVNNAYILVDPGVNVVDRSQNAVETTMVLESSGSAAISLGQWSFPGQRVELDKKSVDFETGIDGRMVINVSAGTHELVIRFVKGIPFILGRCVSIASIIALASYLIIQSKRKNSL